MAEKKTASLSDARIKMIENQQNMDKDPAWKEMVPVFIPREKEKGSHQFVAINGRSFLVKRGEQVMVPKPVAKVLQESMAADNALIDFVQELKDKEI